MQSSKNSRNPIIQELAGPVPLEKIPSLEWDKNNEHLKLEGVKLETMKLEGVKHSHSKLLPCGLFIMKSHPFMGATPDNIFICK